MRHALAASVLTGVSGQAALIISGVVAARLLGVDDRGNLALLTVLPLIIAQFGGLGLPLAVTFEIAREPAIARPLLRSVSRFVILQTIVLTLLHVAILVVVVGGAQRDIQVAAALTSLAVPSFIALQIGLAVMQGQQRHRAFNVLRLAPAVLYAAAALAVFAVGSGTLPVLAGCGAVCWLATAAVTLAVAIGGSLPGGSPATPPPTRQLVRFGTRSMLGSAPPSDGSGIDQAAVALLLSTRALGLYVIATAFMNLSRFVTQSVGLVAYPAVARRRDAGDADRAMWRFAAVGVVAALAILIVLEVTVGRLIVLFFGESFAPATGAARVLLLAAFFLGVRRVLSDAARGANRPLIGTVAELTSCAMLIGGAVVLTPPLDLYGVPTALAIASAASLAVIICGVRRPRKPEAPGSARAAGVRPDVAIGAADVG